MKTNRCCGFPLQTGGLIIGVLEIIGGIIGVIITASMLSVDIVAVEQELDKPNSEINGEIPLSDDERHLGLILYKVSCSVFLIISCVQVLVSSVLIHGIRKKSSSLMPIWMIFKVIFIIILILLLVASCYVGISRSSFLLFLIFIKLNIFYVRVVYYLRIQFASNHVVQSSGGDGLPKYMDLNQA